MTKYIITLFIVFIGQTKLFSQNPEKVTIDSTHYYYKLVPKTKPVGTIIILHGGSEDAKGVMNQITLDEIALKNNFIVIFPNIEDDDFKMTIHLVWNKISRNRNKQKLQILNV